ncbi:MAG TPA: hypothetical protein DD795_10300, partial [Erythrobacter sp.]|nr:hypothetical protein [Erythrobacter sp.]
MQPAKDRLPLSINAVSASASFLVQPWAACHRSTVTNSQPAISARNLTLSLGTREAPVDILRGIDLEIARGSTVALLGPSGSGKSSLMAVLSGLERASGGSLQV